MSRWPVHFRLGVLAASLAVCGCARSTGPIFDASRSGLAWPPPPHPARIRYLGQIGSAADLRAPRSPLAALGDLAVGKKEPPRLYGPRAALCTPDGEALWVADPGGRCLHLFDLARRTYRRIEGPRAAPLLTPVDLCLGPDRSIYVCDSEAAAIHRFESHTGRLLESLRVPSELRRPAALIYDDSAGALFVVDAAGHDIKVLDRSGRLLRLIGRRGAAPGEFNFPCGIAAAGDLLWVADAGNHRIQGLKRSGEPVAQFGRAGDAPGDLALPKDVAADSAGHLYVVDARFENVQVFDTAGRLLLFFGEEGSGPGQFWLPGGISIDADDRIWICDTYNRRVQVFQYVGPAPAVPGAKAETP